MQKSALSGRDIDAGRKRINLTLSIEEFNDLLIVAEKQKMEFTTLAGSWVRQRATEESARILKSGYIPIASRGNNLFSKGKK